MHLCYANTNPMRCARAASSTEHHETDPHELITTALNLSERALADYDLETPWYTNFIRSREPAAGTFYIPEATFQVNVPIGLLSGIFLLLSGIDHLTTTLPGVNKWYNHELERNRNKLRWCEYACAHLLALAMHRHATVAYF